MTDDFEQIRPQSIPLTHRAPSGPEAHAQPGKQTSPSIPRRLFALAAVIALGALALAIVPGLVDPPAAPELTQSPDESTPSASPASGATSEGLAPFEALQRQRAQEKAQAELARFVELQLRLEETMQVGEWGQVQLDAAIDLANAGDEAFLAEAFDQSIAEYQRATQALEQLIADGNTRVEAAIADGTAALSALDGDTAAQAFAVALAIDPKNNEAIAGAARAAKLPEIVRLLRVARNHELVDAWPEALQAYEDVLALDPQTPGVGERMQQAELAVTDGIVASALSDGFEALDARRFDTARAAFRRALDLEPGNDMAIAGLQQVSQRSDVVTMSDLEASALEAESERRWRDALDVYTRALKIDPNIQFAKNGRARVEQIVRVDTILDRIIANPDKLSSDKLLRDAQSVLREARDLERPGPELAAKIADAEGLVARYVQPVPVLLQSDNKTRILVSTVGPLGMFDEKRLELRPGAYTVIGSRAGCKDVRRNIVVVPDMPPVDIRCNEPFR